MNFDDDLTAQRNKLRMCMENALSIYNCRTKQVKDYIDLITSWGNHPESPMQLKQMEILSIYNERANGAFEDYERAFKTYYEFIADTYEE